MIEIAKGNLLEARVEALVNTVNTVGVMGKGIALQFKHAFPEMFRDYKKACKAGEVQLRKMHVYDLGNVKEGPRWIVNFPTKGDWREQSRLTDIETGLEDLVTTILRLRIRSIAIPPLGCGNGGLKWADVRPRIEAAFTNLSDVNLLLFEPGSGTRRSVSLPRSV
jgi:O-acetyl-ADP-ribose deacetylase (regulator of RNase III)